MDKKQIFETLPKNGLFHTKLDPINRDAKLKTYKLDPMLEQKLNYLSSSKALDIFLSALRLLIYKYTDSTLISAAYCHTKKGFIDLSDEIIIISANININNHLDHFIENTRLLVNNSASLKVRSGTVKHIQAAIHLIDFEMDEAAELIKSLDRFKSLEFDFSLEIYKQQGTYVVNAKFNGKQFEDWQIDSLLDTFEHIISILLDETRSGKCISEIEFLGPKEQKKLLTEWNFSNKAFATPERLEIAFRENAIKEPDRVVVEYQDRQYTYKEIDIWSDKVACEINKLYDKKNIAVCMEKSIELVITVIAILKSGFTYVPIDPKYPLSRIQYMLDDSECDLVLVSQMINGLSNHSSRKQVQFNRLNTTTSSSMKVTAYNPIACIIYTSGSTGNPKPVMVSHKSILNFVFNQLQYFGLGQGNRLLQFSSISFDASIPEIWTPMLGMSTMVIPNDKYLSGDFLSDFILENKISAIIIPPSILNTMAAPEKLKGTLKTIISAGEALTKATLDMWSTIIPNFVNAYGPSEATVCTTFFVYKQGEKLDNIIGKPLDGISVYILNTDGALTPIGCVGELYIGGVGVSPGYYNHPELNEGRFIINKLISDEVIYKTGDLSRWLPNANIQYVGRADNQIKINGIRVELEEIENHLSTYPDVLLCAVIAVEEQTEKKLVAYYTVYNSEVQKNNSLKKLLREHLLKKLSPSIVPHKYILIDEFPRLPNGKIDRNKLTECKPIEDTSVGDDTLLSEVESKIAKIYSEVLAVKYIDIGSSTDFFELGGTSLQAIKALAIINEVFNARLSIDAFFNSPTVLAISNLIQNSMPLLTDSALFNELALLYAEVLGCNQDDIDYAIDFFELGGTSLSAIKLLSKIKDNYHLQISVDEFFAQSSINNMVKIISQKDLLENEEALDEDILTEDLFFDIDSIVEHQEHPLEVGSDIPKEILLTGANGFLGAYLLSSLLKTISGTTIHCLIKPSDNQSSIQKLKNALSHYGLNDIDFDRIVVHEGNFGKPNLGLPQEKHHDLAKKIDSIYHCGAMVNHLYTYQMLRSANVLGTIELIKFGVTLKRKQFNYISALDVAMIKQHSNDFYEEKINAQKEMGYIQTKWVSEYILGKSADLFNIDIKIYRPGNIIGDLKQGIMDPYKNHFLMLTKACLQLGYSPDANSIIEMTPVDIIAESIARLSLQKSDANPEIHNLSNPSYISWNDYMDHLRDRGYKISTIDTPQWITYVTDINSDNVLFPFKDFYIKNGIRFNNQISSIDSGRTFSLLNNLGINYPDDYKSLNHAYFEQLEGIGFLS